jgi:hypothetical protein
MEMRARGPQLDPPLQRVARGVVPWVFPALALGLERAAHPQAPSAVPLTAAHLDFDPLYRPSLAWPPPGQSPVVSLVWVLTVCCERLLA